MRIPFVAGNWKMHKTAAEAVSLVDALFPQLNTLHTIERVLCPPATALAQVHQVLKGSAIGLGAQNMYSEEAGAYTGEISPLMVKEFCRYVILGHSERRTLFGETDESVNRKTNAALAHDLIPIVCIGETLSENEAGQTANVIIRQVADGLKGIDARLASKIVIAYEPIWAIGTGKAATGQDANQVVARYIRPTLAGIFGSGAAQDIRVLYGGSVKADNATEFFNQPEIDGALVGGASLKAADFIGIAQAAAASQQ
ncbi:MAG: triose-phosphate isomerase [Anaerolineaceae bacterium]|nr:triose-phosphate isomerase [Anaerolineaceae bacterium]